MFLMKTTSPAGAVAALAALYSQDPRGIERCFEHLTPPALKELDKNLLARCLESIENNTNSSEDELEVAATAACHRVVAQAVIRRKVHQCLQKYSTVSSPQTVEEALKYYTLPEPLQMELKDKYGNDEDPPPNTWFDALQQLQHGNNDVIELWKLILDHPMTAYVPVQCQTCGYTIPDEYPPKASDKDVGLSEEDPRGDELEIRSGWFRGPRRRAKVFVLDCPDCHSVSRWYRSGHPKIILNPKRWGRLCGEQEDLRLDLANYLNVSVRTCLPLDWDHVWGEFSANISDGDSWQVHDESCRNFAARLDEGIGAWTGVWTIHPNPKLCCDVTEEYLSCQQQGGRAEDSHASNMNKYREIVGKTRNDHTATSTQAKTLYGYVVQRANFPSSEEITSELQQAAKDYGMRRWWQLK